MGVVVGLVRRPSRLNARAKSAFTEISFLAMILSIARIMAKENHGQRKSPSPFKLVETSDERDLRAFLEQPDG